MNAPVDLPTIDAPRTESARFRAHPLVRIEPAERGSWLLSREDKLSGHRVPAPVAALLVASFTPGTIDQLATPIRHIVNSPGRSELFAEWLIANDYLVGEDDAQAAKTARWLDSWAMRGWRAASRYHARTYGYPFEFYETDGNSNEDVRRMVSYNADRPDLDRARPSVIGASASYELPSPSERLFPVDIAAVANGSAVAQPLDYERLAALLSLLARPVKRSRMPFPEAADLLRKTSPSGGSRHPTEFHVVSHGVKGMKDGLYQLSAIDGRLDSVDDKENDPLYWSGVAGVEDAGDYPWALVLYSSHFARNRYRYREPRTFRTVHMDVGHLMGTAEYLGRANGWVVEQTQHLDGKRLATALGVDNRVEAPIAMTFLHQAR